MTVTYKEFITEAKKFTKDDVLKYMVSKGNNKNDASKLIDKEYDYVINTYPNATVSKVAEIIINL